MVLAHLDSSYPGVWTEVSIVESSIGKPMETAKTSDILPSHRDSIHNRCV